MSDSKKQWNGLGKFSKTQYKNHGNPFSVSRVVTRGLTDNTVKIISEFLELSSGNEPKFSETF
jgi:hypothetical protein